MGWIGCVRCEKFQCDFMAQICALIAPVQPILHQVLCSNERLPNAPKHYETHQNMSLGSNGVDRVDSLQKKSDANSLHELLHYLLQFSLFCTEFHAVTKQSKMHPSTTKHTNTWVKIPVRGIGCVNCEKFRCDFMAQTCALIAPFQPVLHRISSINETLPNAPKHYETHKNMSLGINWVDRVRSF